MIDKWPIDLNLVYREIPKNTQGRTACTKVINWCRNTCFWHILDKVIQILLFTRFCRLCYFYDDILWINIILFYDPYNSFRQHPWIMPNPGNIISRYIHRYRNKLIPFLNPFIYSLTDPLQNIQIQMNDKSIPLHGRNKPKWLYHFSVMNPSCKCLCTYDLTCPDINLRLIIHLKFPFLQRLRKHLFHPLNIYCFFQHLVR